MKLKTLFSLLCAAALMAPAAALAAPFGPIAGMAATDVDLFAGTTHDLNVGFNGTISDLNVSIELGGDGIQYGDLDIFLVHGGVSVQLLDNDMPEDCCTGSALFDVTFDDEASSTIPNEELGEDPDAVGAFQPQNGSLSDFDGLDVFGTWQLQIFEIECCEGETNLVSWSISGIVDEEIPPNPVPEPGTALLLGMGLMGLAARRRSA